MDNNDNVIFRETQHMHQWWILLILLLSDIPVIGIFGWGIYQQIILGRPWGDNPMSNVALVINSLLATLIVTAAFALIIVSHLITEVRRDGLYIRYYPFHLSWRKISLSNVARIEARTYDPLGEYGGWGIRGLARHRAYNTSGNLGVRIDYLDGANILIGSQKPEELLKAIESIR